MNARRRQLSRSVNQSTVITARVAAALCGEMYMTTPWAVRGDEDDRSWVAKAHSCRIEDVALMHAYVQVSTIVVRLSFPLGVARRHWWSPSSDRRSHRPPALHPGPPDALPRSCGRRHRLRPRPTEHPPAGAASYRGGVPSVLGDRPAVLAPQPRQ